MDWRSLETFSVGDGPALADELAGLVLEGKKTATCWAASDGLLTEVGKRMVMLDGSGRPRAVIETVELTQRRFLEVDAAFAHSASPILLPLPPSAMMALGHSEHAMPDEIRLTRVDPDKRMSCFYALGTDATCSASPSAARRHRVLARHALTYARGAARIFF
jgi:hypothetical protein